MILVLVQGLYHQNISKGIIDAHGGKIWGKITLTVTDSTGAASSPDTVTVKVSKTFNVTAQLAISRRSQNPIS